MSLITNYNNLDKPLLGYISYIIHYIRYNIGLMNN